MSIQNHSIIAQNHSYWTHRSSGYSVINQDQLKNKDRERWLNLLRSQIVKHFPKTDFSQLKVLDIGTGPGFLSILLAQLGCQTSAIDLTEAMLEEARHNAGDLADRISFSQMNAEDLLFADASFDLIVSRNLTWNLPHPDLAYREWYRVLRPQGLLLNFDANWYAYLFDAQAREAYIKDRETSARLGLRDFNIGENFDQMEEIARQLPLSKVRRPIWDHEFLSRLSMEVVYHENIGERLWSDVEKTNFASTPLFLIEAYKR